MPALAAGRSARPRRGTSPPARKRRQVAALHTLRAFLRPLFLLRALLLGAVLLAGGAGAATLTVTNLADHGPGTLRQLIADASPGDTLDFAVTGPLVRKQTQ